MEVTGATSKVQYASLRQGTWTAAVTLVDSPDLFVNWADTPKITRGGDGALYAYWPLKSGEDTYAYDVVLGRSADDGETWTELGKPHDDGTQTEHGFVSLVPTRTGIEVIWLDGRAIASDGPMSLRSAAVGEKIGPTVLVDDSVCDCCGTDAAQTVEGPVVVYRDRTEEEIRDIGIVRREGDKWAVPSMVFPDRWKIAGCPVNGPRVLGRGRSVDVIWFTSQPEPAVQFAVSRDGGRSFGRPMRFAGAQTLGRVDLVADGKTSVLLSWMDVVEDQAVIRVSRYYRTGQALKPFDVASTSAGRASGFPRMAIVGDEVYVFWTGEGPKLAYERVFLEDLNTDSRLKK